MLTVVTVVLFITFLLLASSMTLAINSGEDEPEEPEQTETIDGAGAPEGGTELPPVKPEVDPEVKPETEPVKEPAVEGETPAPEGAAGESEVQSPEPAEPAEPAGE